MTSVMFVGAMAVAAGCADGKLRIWDAFTAKCLQSWPHGCDGGNAAVTAIGE